MKPYFLLFLFCNLSSFITAQEFKTDFDHHALAVKDITTSVAFYKNVLKLSQMDTPLDNPLIKWFSLGDKLQLHLIETEELDIKTHKSNHFSVRVENITDFISHLNTNKIPFWDWVGNKGKVALRPDGVQQVYIQDPDGYWIEINDAKYN